jgi:pyruvate dehydrogenase E1 component beta subunit
VINLRSIRPLDRDTIINSVKKTSRIVSFEEGWPQSGIGSEIISIINESMSFAHPPTTANSLNDNQCISFCVMIM